MTVPYLAGLGSVDWTVLEHAQGTARDVPAALTHLAAGQPAEAAGAVESLFTTICHQGSVFPATVAAVPFLAGVATDPRAPGRDGAVELLAEIAGAPFDFVTPTDWYTDRAGAIARGAHYGMGIEPACRDAVLAVAARVVDALPDASPLCRLWTLAVTAGLGEAHSVLAPAIEANASRFADPWLAVGLDLFRTAVEPAPRPDRAAVAHALARKGVPSAGEFDQDVVSGALATVATHLTRPSGRHTTAPLLHRYASQVGRIVYAPTWRDLAAAASWLA